MTTSDQSEITRQALAECDRLIAHFESRATRHKRFYKWLSVSSIVLTASVTALAGILTGHYRIVTTVLAALSTIAAAILAASQAQQLWVVSRNTSQKLIAEKFLFLQQAALYADQNTEVERARQFSERVVNIWNEGHASWQEKVLDTDADSSNPNTT